MAGGKGKDNTLITCPEWGGGGKKISMMQKMVQGALGVFISWPGPKGKLAGESKFGIW